jgi:putative hydrolase of the HAD superfamily
MGDAAPSGRVTDAILLDLYDTIAWIPDGTLLREELAAAADVDPGVLQDAWAATYLARTTGQLDSLDAEIAEVLLRCGVEPSAELVTRLVELESEAWRAVALFDDVLPFVARQRAVGRRVAIVSNCSRQTRDVIRAYGLEEATDAVVLSCDVGAAKPDPAIFETALGRVEAAPSRAIFVDDIVDYLDGAAALGMDTAQIVRPQTGGRGDGGHRVVTNLNELDELLG